MGNSANYKKTSKEAGMLRRIGGVDAKFFYEECAHCR